MIKEYEFYHGVVFTRLFNKASIPLCAGSYAGGSNASYVLKYGERTAGLYIKHSTKRLAPWSYTFLQEHQDEMARIKAELGEVFLVLVCGENGIVVLNYQELKTILDENYEPTEWIRVTRSKRKMYMVSGKDGALDCKIGEMDFPRKILNYFMIEEEVKLPESKFQNNFSLHALAEGVRSIFGQGKVSASDG